MSHALPDTGLAREDLCRFLSACYYEPCEAFREEGLFTSLTAAATAFAPALVATSQRLSDAFKHESLPDLLVDYTRLFIGPGRPLAIPYGSFWLSPDQALMGESTGNLVALYREGGFDVAEDLGEPPDHIAIELEFLYLIDFRIRQAQHSGDAQSVAAFATLRERLLREHLGAWGDLFCTAVTTLSGTQFYRELGNLTAQFLSTAAT